MDNVNIKPFACTGAQAARLLGISKTLFYKLLNSGRIPIKSIRLTPKKILYSVDEIREYVRAGMPEKWGQNETT